MFGHTVTSSMVRVDKSSIVSMERAIWMYFAGTEWRNLETASSSSMVTPWLFSLLMSVYRQGEKSSTDSPSLNLRSAYSYFRSWAVAFFARSEPACIAVMASHASLAELFAPNGSLYSTGTAARIASNVDMSSSSLSVPLSMVF